MYKLIIVDDETVTRDDLADLISMQDTGFEIAGLFNDGLEAKKYIETNRVDVLITDIKMPCMNGLDLAEYVYNNYPDIAIIIISGYEEFEYARRSLEYNIKKYILKPIDFDEMLEILEKIKNVLDMETDRRNSYFEWKTEKQLEFFRKLYLGLFNNEQEILNEFTAEEFSFDFEQTTGRIIKISFKKYDEFIEQYWRYGKERVSVAIKNIIDQVYENSHNYILFQHSNEITAMIFDTIQKDNELEKCIEEIMKVNVSVSQTLKFNSLVEISNGFFEEADILEVVTRGITAVVSMDIQQAQGMLRNYIGKLLVKDNSEELLVMFKKKLLNAMSVYWDVSSLRDINISDFVENIGEYIIEFSRGSVKYDNVIIERSKEFMLQNYNRDISVLDISKSVCLGADYFGRYFKRITGQSVNAFLLDIRMKKAIEYLETGKTIKEISDMVGYADYRYFLRVFKKYTGFSPSKYKK